MGLEQNILLYSLREMEQRQSKRNKKQVTLRTGSARKQMEVPFPEPLSHATASAAGWMDGGKDEPMDGWYDESMGGWMEG